MCKAVCAGLCVQRLCRPATDDFTRQMGADFGWVAGFYGDEVKEGQIAARLIPVDQRGAFGGVDQV